MESVWSKTATRPQFERLKGDIKTDVLIIGGGLTGLLCAYMLREAGVDCVLAEADRICGGITKNTTAKITLQHGLIYDKLIRKLGMEGARLYLDTQREAMKCYRKLGRTVSCDMVTRDSFVYSIDDREKIEKEADALNKIGCSASFVKDTALPFSVAGAVKVEDQMQFHPLKFAFEISKGLPIFESTRVLEFRPDSVLTDGGKITAKKIIVATHFPMLNKHGSYFLKMYQQRSYVLALENAPDVNGMYVDASGNGFSFRDYNGLLLLGGGGHRTGKQGGGWKELSDFAGRYYPKAVEKYRWATQDCMTLDGIPYIGQYSARTPNLYVATGFNKWGMTSAMVAATLLTDLVQEKQNPYAELFSPSRSMLCPQLALNTLEALVGLLTPTVPRCPHMGCALKYNRQEHTWDCSCHGSRFTESGKLIDNPATGDKKGS